MDMIHDPLFDWPFEDDWIGKLKKNNLMVR